MSSQGLARLIGISILIFVAVIMASSGTYVIQPGYRGVEITLGKVSPAFKPEGLGMKVPFITEIEPISVRQQTAEDKADCYSFDLQQIHVELRVLFRIPESSVVQLYQGYFGDHFDSLVAPRVQEALKEVASLQSAEKIVKNREQIKTQALELARKKIGTLFVLEDIVILNIALTRELEHAIEAKMVQEQEASKSKYLQQRVQVEADTAVIQAKGEAESMRIRGQALRENPSYIDLKIVERWDGLPPLVIGAHDNLMIPIQELERQRQIRTNAAPAGRAKPR